METLVNVAMYVALREDFFIHPCQINCPISEFCAFPGADTILGIDEALRSETVDIGLGVLVSRPVDFPLVEACGEWTRASLSHKGIFAVCFGNIEFSVDFVNLVTGERGRIEVEDITLVGFYNNLAIFLTGEQPLREVYVNDVFKGNHKIVLRVIGNVESAHYYSDVSLLNETRILYFRTQAWTPYSYNVDTKEEKRILEGRSLLSFACLTGVDVGCRAVFHGDGCGESTYAINNDGSIETLMDTSPDGLLTVYVPSYSQLHNPHKGMRLYANNEFYIGETKGGRISNPFDYNGSYSIVRLYQDIFIVLDERVAKWVLVRIIVV